MLFKTPHQQGVRARKSGKGRHENPFIRDRTWFEYNLLDLTREDLQRRKTYWDQGWDEENKVRTQSAESKSV